MNIKFTTWNMAFWSHKELQKESWEFYLDEVESDILLFQESYPDYSLLDKSKLVWNEIGGSRPWGSGVYSHKYPIREFSIKTNFFGSVTCAEITLSNNETLIVVSLYGLMEKIGNVTYAIPNLHRIFSDLTGLIESRNTRHKVIIGGDFNASKQIDEQQIGNSHKVLFDRLKEFQLTNCFDNYFSDFVQTHRHIRSEKLWQNDYFFISNKLATKLKNCSVLDNELVRKFSDHNPVIIELDL